MNTSQSVMWWSEGDPMPGLWATLNEIDDQDVTRIDAYARYLEQYDVQLPAGGRRGNTYRQIDEEALAPNKFRRVLDTIHAKIVRNKILPQAVSTSGNYTTRAAAKSRSLFIEGLFATERIDQLDDMAARDALLCGFAAVKVSSDGARVNFERLKPWCIKLREAECNGGLPRRLYYADDYDRGVLAEMFPEHEAKIMAAPMAHRQGTSRLLDSHNPDAIRVCEAWALGGEGRHVISIEGFALLDEQYAEATFPVAILRFYAPPIGFFPVPIAKLILPIQRELEATAAKIQATFRLMSHAHFIVPPGVEFSTEQITNEPGTIWRANPGQIQAFAPPVVSSDLYRYFTDLGPMMTEMSGASQMSVANQKPGGVTSGIALQTLDDVESEGFIAMHRAWQDWHVTLARLGIAAAAIVAEDNPDFSVRVLGKGRASAVRWSDADLSDADYEIRVMPTSQFARDFAGRIDQAEKLLQLGALSIPQFRDILDLPDLQAETDLDLSSRHVIERNVDAILTKNMPIIAEPFDDLAMILEYGPKAYNLARLEDADPIALELLRRYIMSAQDLMPKPPEPQQPAMPEMMP